MNNSSQSLVEKIKLLEKELYALQLNKSNINKDKVSDRIDDIYNQVIKSNTLLPSIDSVLIELFSKFEELVISNCLINNLTKNLNKFITTNSIYPGSEIPSSNTIVQPEIAAAKYIVHLNLNIIKPFADKANIGFETQTVYQRKNILIMLNKYIIKELATRTQTNENRNEILICLSICRILAKELNLLDAVYMLSSVLVQRFIHTYDFEGGKSVFNSIMEKSIMDGKAEYGYLLNARFYFLQKDLYRALCHMRALVEVLINNRGVNERFYAMVLNTLMEIFFKFGVIIAAEQMHDNIHLLNTISVYQKVAVDSTYLEALIKTDTDADIIAEKIILFTNRNLVHLSFSPILLAPQYLNTIYNFIRKNKSNIKITELELIASNIASLLPDKEVKLIQNKSLFTDEFFKTELITLLYKLSKSKSGENLRYDLKGSLHIAYRALEYAVSQNDINLFSLVTLIATGYSTIDDYQLPENLQLDGFEISAEIQEFYNTYIVLQKTSLIIESQQLFLWIAVGQINTFTLQLYNKEFSSINTLANWKIDKMEEWLTLYYQRIAQSRGSNWFKVADKLYLPRFELYITGIPNNASEVLLIKHTKISSFPHNLFLNENKEYISITRPIVDILSTEWLIKNQHNTLIRDISVEAYIPTDAGDADIIEVENKLQKTFKKLNIKVSHKVIPDFPLSGQVNIIVGHGADNIAEFQNISIGENNFVGIDEIVGNGKIAVLFICNAGKTQSANIGHKVLSLTRAFFDKGYQVVIAPAWDLMTSIPSIWLPIFLHRINEGATAAQAFHDANTKVRIVSKLSEYWACLHFYGNPNLKLE